MKDKIELSDVAEIIMGQSPDSNSCNTIELGMPFLQGCGEFGKKYPIIENYCESPRKISPKNSILISVRAPVGDINIADKDFVIGRGLAGIVAKNINRDFLYYSVLQFRTQLQRVSQGSTFKAINTKNLHEFQINYFNSNQQRKIAEILSTVDAVLEKTEAAIAKYQQLKQGLMHDVFTRGIDVHTGQLRPKQTEAPELYKQSALGWIPKEWEVEELGNVGDVKMCKRIFTYQTKSEGEIPFFKIGTFGKKPDAYITRELFEEFKSKYSYPSLGSILISASGTIGRLVIYNGEDAYFQDSNIVWIENNFEIISNEFLRFVFPFVKFKTEGGTIQRLYNNILKSGMFPCPKDKNEQELITLKLQSIDQKIDTEQQALAKYQQLKAGLMQDLLTGRIEVLVD